MARMLAHATPTPNIEARSKDGSRTASTDRRARPPSVRQARWMERALKRFTSARSRNENANATRL
jgi:hypothetical protein